MPEIPVEELSKEIDVSMEALTDAALEISKDPGIKLRTDTDETFDIEFNNGTRLSSLLPQEIELVQAKLPTSEAHILWDAQGNITVLRVNLNVAWFDEEDNSKKSTLAHEIGHALSVHEHYKLAHAIPDVQLKEVAETEEELFAKIQYTLFVASEEIAMEVEAWNYGKIIAHMFGVPGDEYDGEMTGGIATYVEGNLIQIHDELAYFIDDYAKPLSAEAASHLFTIYDASMQSTVQLSLSEIKALADKAYEDHEAKKWDA